MSLRSRAAVHLETAQLFARLSELEKEKAELESANAEETEVVYWKENLPPDCRGKFARRTFYRACLSGLVVGAEKRGRGGWFCTKSAWLEYRRAQAASRRSKKKTPAPPVSGVVIDIDAMTEKMIEREGMRATRRAK